MSSQGAAGRENRLIHETSPYLLQHAHNPVDWYPWGEEALARARAEDKPILLSIGYAACHWCHVMERESFENEAIAAKMNAAFVCIKVDREERPDLDDIYMAATVAMSGHGGWPMTVFLTPDQRPFFAGTYFPPTDKYGRPGFATVLDRIAALWQDNREDLAAQAAELTERVQRQSASTAEANIDSDATRKAVADLEASYDAEHGGFGSAPKFPPSAALALLLRYHLRTGQEGALRAALGTLDGMKNGGIYDHLGGGFARYSTDARWLVPHFEKMLYDNAQLAPVYLAAWQLTRDEEYARVARETLDYVVREMQSEAGGYFSATDADSEGVEGKYFVWTPDEVRDVLPDADAEAFCEYYDITPGGNWEGVSILNTPRSAAVVAGELGLTEAALRESIQRSKPLMLAARSERVPPLLDDKILVAWNGLMISAMAEGYRVLGTGTYLESAERAARYVTTQMRRADGGLFRTARQGKAHLLAYLEDYAYLANALVDLYEAGGNRAWLDAAESFARRMLDDFAADDGGAFFHTAKNHEELLVRTREGQDGALPNPNAVAALALARLAFHFDRSEWKDRATATLRAYGRYIARAPRAFATSLAASEFLLEGPTELVFAGPPEAPELRALRDAVAREPLPHRVIAYADDGSNVATTPLTEGKTQVNGNPALYVCRDFTCQAPVTEPEAVATALNAHRSRWAGAAKGALSAPVLDGRATPAATAALAAQHRDTLGPQAYAPLGTTGLTVSRLGFGGYRVSDDSADQRAALTRAVLGGINLIDTSTNYTDGGSERLIGSVLAELVRKDRLSRESSVVVTKVGYVQGENLELARSRAAEGRPFADMVEYRDTLWHCIHPDWIADQLSRSLSRLGLATVDVCLLHNPEYFLEQASEQGRPLVEARAEYYARIEHAFAQLEREVSAGRIAWYGVSSNTAVSAQADADATDLTLLLRAATRAGGEHHHFRVLQLPFNLLEPGARFEANTGNPPLPVLKAAADREVAILANRPLNAVTPHGLVRLADPPEQPPGPPVPRALADVARLEEEFAQRIAPALKTAQGSPVDPDRVLGWAKRLDAAASQINSLERWKELESLAIYPELLGTLNSLDRTLGGQALGDAWREMRERYLPAIDALLQSLGRRAADRSRARALALSRALAPTLPSGLADEPLATKALLVLRSCPGVTSVLVGMRTPQYVQDAQRALVLEDLENPDAALRAAGAADLPGL